MRKLMMLAPVLALAVSGANCAGDSSSSGSPTGPSSVVTESTTAGKNGKPAGGGGTTGGSGSLSLVMVTDVGTSGTSFSDRVTFAVSTSATAYPWVTVKCVQNGSLVSQESNGIFPTSLDRVFSLGPTPN